MFVLALQIEACKPLGMTSKVASVIEIIDFYDARALFWSLRPQNMINCVTRSAEKSICMGKLPVSSLGVFFITFSWSV